MRVILLAVLGLALAWGSRQETPAERPVPATELYPCRASATVVRFFHIENDTPDLAKLNPALAELGATLAHGPRSSSGRPGHAFVAVRAPRSASAKKLASALKKGGGAVGALAATAFDGRTGQESDLGLGGYGVSQRDLVMGISNDVVWYDACGTWSQFYGAPRKLDARELSERYAKLYEPYGGAKLGAVVREDFTWALVSAPEPKLAAKLVKSIEKLPGVESASFGESSLALSLLLDGLEVCGDVGALTSTTGEPLEAADAGLPRVAFDAGALYEFLAAEKLVP